MNDAMKRRRPLPASGCAFAIFLALAGAAVVVPGPAAAADAWRLAQARSEREWQGERLRRDLDSGGGDRRGDAGRGDSESRYPQRLSPDERRQLRRDLHDANRDIPQRRRPQRR